MDWKLFLTVFGTVLVAESGDKTQLATLLYASDARHGKATVLVASIAALAIAASIGVLAGATIGRWVPPQTLRFVAGLGFIAVGVWTLVRS